MLVPINLQQLLKRADMLEYTRVPNCFIPCVVRMCFIINLIKYIKMKTKEQLQEELRQIEEKELNELIEKHYPEFKALEGKCFKVRNCYSCPENESDYWFLYVKIQKIEKDDLYKSSDNILAHFHGWNFQTDKYGRISVEFEYNNYVHSMSEETEITNEEFKTAWLQLQAKLSTADV